MKYILIDMKNGDSFEEEFENLFQALETGKYSWNHLTREEQKNREAFYILESINPNQDAEDHLDGVIIKDFKSGNDLFEEIASYMNDEIREDLHSEIWESEPEDFLKAYIEKDPEFLELVKHEFSNIYEAFN